jgi:hypothetical protein
LKTYYQAAQPKGREGREEAWRQNLQPPGAPLTQNVKAPSIMKYYITLISVLSFCLLVTANVIGAEIIDFQEKIDSITLNGIVVSPSQNKSEIIQSIGSPISREEVKDVKNKYYEFNDKVTLLKYDNLLISIYSFRHPENGWEKVAQIVVGSSKWNLPYGIEIGQNESQIKQTLGMPHQEAESGGETRWYYFPSDGEPHLQIILTFKAGKLHEFTWSHWP